MGIKKRKRLKCPSCGLQKHLKMATGQAYFGSVYCNECGHDAGEMGDAPDSQQKMILKREGDLHLYYIGK